MTVASRRTGAGLRVPPAWARLRGKSTGLIQSDDAEPAMAEHMMGDPARRVTRATPTVDGARGDPARLHVRSDGPQDHGWLPAEHLARTAWGRKTSVRRRGGFSAESEEEGERRSTGTITYAHAQ